MRDTSLLSELTNALRTPERSISDFPTKAKAKKIRQKFNLSYNSTRIAKAHALNLSRTLSTSKLLILDDDIVKKAVEIFYDGDTDFKDFFSLAIVPYSNCFIEWNETLRMEETKRQYLKMKETLSIYGMPLEELEKHLPVELANKIGKGKILEKNHNKIINEQISKVNEFYFQGNITGDVKVGFHMRDLHFKDYIGYFDEFPTQFQNNINEKFHEFVPYALGTNIDGKRQVFCNFNSIMFDPDVKVGKIFDECILEQFIAKGEKEDDFFHTIDRIKKDFLEFGITFFGSSFMETQDYLEDRLYYNWQSNRDLFFTDFESVQFDKRIKEKIPQEIMPRYIPFIPFNMGAFLFICLGLLNHQKIDIVDVPSRDQKRSMSFGNQTPRKEYHLIKFKVSDKPKTIAKSIAKNIGARKRKETAFHERAGHYRKYKTVNGIRIALDEKDWIRVSACTVGNKKYGEIHKDWHIVKDS